MKRICTSILIVITLLSCLLLTSCTSVSSDDAEALINDFCSALAEDDYETAASYMHPICNLDANSLKSSIENMEKTLSIDFADGIELGDRTYWYKSANFNTNGIKGAYTALSMKHNISISGKDFVLETTVIGDKTGLMISTFRISANQSVNNNEA
ncbi:MAG: hypothetical protein IJW02_04850 [Clostridia bacterium]|nr:hypothetical protein [Clostridia bacterium]